MTMSHPVITDVGSLISDSCWPNALPSKSLHELALWNSNPEVLAMDMAAQMFTKGLTRHGRSWRDDDKLLSWLAKL